LLQGTLTDLRRELCRHQVTTSDNQVRRVRQARFSLRSKYAPPYAGNNVTTFLNYENRNDEKRNVLPGRIISRTLYKTTAVVVSVHTTSFSRSVLRRTIANGFPARRGRPADYREIGSRVYTVPHVATCTRNLIPRTDDSRKNDAGPTPRTFL